jgi:hypothetical protein
LGTAFGLNLEVWDVDSFLVENNEKKTKGLGAFFISHVQAKLSLLTLYLVLSLIFLLQFRYDRENLSVSARQCYEIVCSVGKTTPLAHTTREQGLVG